MLTEEECKAVEDNCIEEVRNAIKLITSGDIWDRNGYLNSEGYKALETLEGLDLFWICDPMIELRKAGGESK